MVLKNNIILVDVLNNCIVAIDAITKCFSYLLGSKATLIVTALAENGRTWLAELGRTCGSRD